jgi:hypothetical protein
MIDANEDPADRERDERVQTHARGERDWQVCEETHHRRGEGRRETRRHHDGARGHPGRAQDRRVYEDDIGHRHEGGEAAENFAPERRASLTQVEHAVQWRLLARLWSVIGLDCSAHSCPHT